MFRCHFCGQVAPANTTRHSVVLETRQKTYVRRRKESRGRGGFRNRNEDIQDRGGSGIEVVREVSSCPTCAAKEHEVIHQELPATVEAVETPETEQSEE